MVGQLWGVDFHGPVNTRAQAYNSLGSIGRIFVAIRFSQHVTALQRLCTRFSECMDEGWGTLRVTHVRNLATFSEG